MLKTRGHHRQKGRTLMRPVMVLKVEDQVLQKLTVQDRDRERERAGGREEQIETKKERKMW